MSEQTNIGVVPEETKKKPVKHFRAGAIVASVWKNEFETKQGGKGYSYNVTTKRSYKDKQEKWQETDSIGVNDLPRSCYVQQQAYEWIIVGGDESG